ncbi:MAG: DUF86 domain-containing protein [Proteobacteria bacterium]|nr:DUF86 domain-containing protein [Pseudomonadota bacterium]
MYKGKERQILDYLNDILESISDIKEFVVGIDYENFLRDKKTSKAVIRSLEIIGEAAKNIPEPLRNSQKEIPWQEIMGMRNKLAHEYFGVDLDIVWQSIHEDVSPLEAAVKEMLLAINQVNMASEGQK